MATSAGPTNSRRRSVPKNNFGVLMLKLQSIKRWHWMLIGAIAGLAVAYGQFSSLTENSVGLGDGKMTQTEFERELRSPPVDKLPILKDIEIHPRFEHDRVELKRLRFTSTGTKYESAFF